MAVPFYPLALSDQFADATPHPADQEMSLITSEAAASEADNAVRSFIRCRCDEDSTLRPEIVKRGVGICSESLIKHYFSEKRPKTNTSLRTGTTIMTLIFEADNERKKTQVKKPQRSSSSSARKRRRLHNTTSSADGDSPLVLVSSSSSSSSGSEDESSSAAPAPESSSSSSDQLPLLPRVASEAASVADKIDLGDYYLVRKS